MDGHELVFQFLDSSPAFAHGVEIGILHERMKNEDEINDTFHTANQEQITLMANRLGWKVLNMEQWKQHPDQWFFLHMVRE